MIDIDQEIKEAILQQTPTRLNVLRSLKTAVSTVLSSKGRNGKPLTDDEMLALVRKQIAQREDSIEQFIKGGREDAAAVEKREKKILEQFLPEQMGNEQVAQLIARTLAETGATSKKDAGKAIARAKELAAGRVEPRKLSQLIMAKLA